VQRRDELLAFDYLLLDKQGNRIAGALPITRLGWSDVSAASGLSGERRPRTFRVRTVQLDDGMRLSVAEDLRFTADVRRAWLEACGLGLIAFLIFECGRWIVA
ncbi:MAG: hypothetical protein WBW37_18940, partial [Methyloceanibacter sp.]